MVFPYHELPDAFWESVRRCIPPEPPKDKRGGRPRTLTDRQALGGVLYRLRTGCQWPALPRHYGAWQSVYRRFRQWSEAGVFEEMWRVMLVHYDELKGIDWQWTSADAFMTKAPKGGTWSAPRRSTGAAAGRKSTS